MKIAILTQPLGQNYGGIMQAYALQKTLRDLGHDVVTIDRRPDRRRIAVKVLLLFKPVVYKCLGKKLGIQLTTEQNKYIYSGMTDFVKKNIRLSEPISNTADLKSHYKRNAYDLVVVGSDQVWRPRYSPNLYNFFVDFLEKNDKSISYAASFGVDDWEFDEKQTKKCKKLVKNFNAISVREVSAIKLCMEKLGVSSELVLDPTMLISAESYKELLPRQKSGDKGKVLKYILDDSELKTSLVKKITSQLQKPIFAAQPARNLLDSGGHDLSEYKYPSVEEWIMSFRDADFVITDSFHGCVFSIIFNKPFIAIGNRQRGLSRFESLLKIFDLNERLVLSDEENIHLLVDQKIDWERVNLILARYQRSSLAFINKWA